VLRGFPGADEEHRDVPAVAFGEHGIAVDARLRTTNRHAFAIGDAAGGPQFTHIALYHAGIVIRNALFRLPARVDYRALPWVTYTDPELAQVGLTEAAASAQGPIRVLRWPFADNDRAHTERDTAGEVKIITRRNGRIVGATILGAAAGDLILPWALAIAQKLKISAMANLIAPYPTRGEAGKRAAGSAKSAPSGTVASAATSAASRNGTLWSATRWAAMNAPNPASAAWPSEIWPV